MIASEDPKLVALLVKLHEQVVEMREHQRAFFGGDRSYDRVRFAKKYERAVDEALDEIDRYKYPPPPPPQTSLFGGDR